MRAPLGCVLVGAVCFLALSAGCRRAADRAGSPTRAAAALERSFQAPVDGLLTDADLDLYAKVRRAAKGRPDSDAARAVGVDPEHFGWVQARVIEALVALDSRRVQQEAAETYARTLASLRETRRSVRDPESARALDGRIAQLERERASLRRPESLSPRLAANARRVSVRRAEIESVSSP